LQLGEAGIGRQQRIANRFGPQFGQTVRLRLTERAVKQRRQQRVELDLLRRVVQNR